MTICLGVYNFLWVGRQWRTKEGRGWACKYEGKQASIHPSSIQNTGVRYPVSGVWCLEPGVWYRGHTTTTTGEMPRSLRAIYLLWMDGGACMEHLGTEEKLPTVIEALVKLAMGREETRRGCGGRE